LTIRSYGFVGRDLDILQVERHLLRRRNLLPVRGMGGTGKTTLLRHLESWWRATGFHAVFGDQHRSAFDSL
jgi:ABC-type lipoprotein export system ATPase subunit